MGDRPAARHRAPRSRRRSVGMLCAVLLVPAAALTAVYLASSTGATPTGLASGGQSHAGSALTATAASPAARRTVSTAGTSGAHLPANPARTAGHDHQPTRPRVTASPPPSQSPSPSPSPQASTPPPSQQEAVATQVFAVINQARAQAGLPLYSLRPGPDRSSGA